MLLRTCHWWRCSDIVAKPNALATFASLLVAALYTELAKGIRQLSQITEVLSIISLGALRVRKLLSLVALHLLLWAEDLWVFLNLDTDANVHLPKVKRTHH